MSIWITILLQLLPLLLEWLLKRNTSGAPLRGRDQERLNNVLYYTSRIEAAAVKAGCKKGGVPPEE